YGKLGGRQPEFFKLRPESFVAFFGGIDELKFYFGIIGRKFLQKLFGFGLETAEFRWKISFQKNIDYHWRINVADNFLCFLRKGKTLVLRKVEAFVKVICYDIQKQQTSDQNG